MPVKKSLVEVAREFGEQIGEVHDPIKPERLDTYVDGYRTGLHTLIPALSKDPAIAAIALHGAVIFNEHGVVRLIMQKGTAHAADWPALKSSILVYTNAHGAVKMLEDHSLQDVLVAAVVANYTLVHEQQSRSWLQQASEDEKEVAQDAVAYG